LADLPDLVAGLAARWGLTVGGAFADATEAVVLAATREDGTAAVLKLLIPRERPVAVFEIAFLERAAGEGCARVLDHDGELGALLLERLGRAMVDCGLPIATRHELLCDAAQQLWRPAPDLGLPTGAAKGRWLAEQIATKWERLGRPCSERAVEHALTCVERRIAAHDDERACLVHGDVHQ
jgi:streptomycin 6-kinase